MSRRLPLRLAAALAAGGLALAAMPALAQKPAAPAAPPAPRKESAPLGALGGGGKDPIKIDADRLDVFDRENKAVFAGNVVAVQGDSTIRCSSLTVHYKRGKEARKADGAPGEEAAEKPSMAENGIQKVECAGPVTVVQKDQVATGDNAVFDQTARRIVLTGNVVLSQCQNVTRGSRLVYDMGTGRANMDPVAGGRVSALFVPGEKGDAKGGAKGCPPPPNLARPDSAKPDLAKKAPDGADQPAGKARAQAP
ncbi:LptA/OstA family protein [Methylobacterium durans]|uniref:LptA/OstA family protein n=1 Tax=Methylobacterium durans TaxID=2202825 RepID=UPI002AFE0B1C|nr:LptA/OstA family protein [Methylobacterium durans]MEA1831198.1 LptA/OstA family protein [Methylobacterium durans]